MTPAARAFREGVGRSGPWTLAALVFVALVASALTAPPTLAGSPPLQGPESLGILRLAALAWVLALALPALIEARRSGRLRLALSGPLGRSGWLLGRYFGALLALALWIGVEGGAALGLSALSGGRLDLGALAALLGELLRAAMILALGFIVAPLSRSSSTAGAFCLAMVLLCPMAEAASDSWSGLLLTALPALPDLQALSDARSSSDFLEILSLTVLDAVGYVLSCLALACIVGRLREIE